MSTIASLLDVSRRALNAQSQVLRTIGDNIANVNTPGFSKRKVELVSTQATGIGNLLTGAGVEVERLVRLVDPFLNKELQNRISERSAADVRQEYLGRAESIFKLTNEPGSIGFAMNKFFSSLEDLSVNPADTALRTQVLQDGEFMVSSIKDAYNRIATMQRETDTRIGNLVDQVNTLTSQIAGVNYQIAGGETNEQQNLALRDKRDQLIRDLSEIIPVKVVDVSNREVMVTLSNGFTLVNGSTVNELQFDNSPSFGSFPEGLDGNGLGFIVHDFDSSATESHADFTSLLYTEGSGEIGGLLRLRGVQATGDTTAFDATGDLVEIGSRIETISRDLLTRFNLTYLGDVDENTGTPIRDPNSGGLDGTSPGVYGLFSFAGAVDSNTDGEPNDLNTIALPNYSSLLTFNVTDAEKFAAALDLDDTTPGNTSFAPGDSSNLSRLIALRTETQNYSLGNFTANSTTIEGLYSSVVGYAGGVSSNAKSNLEVLKAREDQIKELQTSVSGVSIDEELSNMINFQRAFQASARMVKVGDELLAQIIGLLG